jgi:hypothetical protein
MPVLGQPELVTIRTKTSVKQPESKTIKELTGINSLVCSINSIALNIIEIPSLVQLATFATEVNLGTVQLSDSCLDVGESICLRSTRGNASSGESLRDMVRNEQSK